MGHAVTGRLDVTELSGALGAEVLGVDLNHLDDGLWAELRNLWHEHLVLFFPGQQLTPEAQIEFGRRVGEVEIHAFLPKHEDHPGIVVLDSNVSPPAEVWHTDVTFSSTPPRASILHMVVSPPVGGDTIWTNQYLAFETLSDPIKELVESLSAVHTAAIFGQPGVSAVHPAVRIHPETGRRALFVNRTFTSHFLELRRGESDALLQYLYSWSEQVNFQCRYRWADGTVAIWDNRCTQHYAVNDYSGRRVIHRVTAIGNPPVGPPTRWKTVTAATAERAPREVDQRSNTVPTPAAS